ncbi:MAG: C1 family peptidase [Acidobacteriia bacterium]|nr:C1 family peptidase [Terriglobia bacterium]
MRLKMHSGEHLIDSLKLAPEHKSALKRLGYISLEQLAGAAQISGRELAAYLGEPIDKIMGQISVAATILPAAAAKTIRTAEYPLGFSVHRYFEARAKAAAAPLSAGSLATFQRLAAAVPKPAVKAEVNLIPQMPPIRNQGERGTCVAHAALSAFEHSLNVNGSYVDLSEQFLYWNCKRNDGALNEEGTYLGVAWPLLQRDGCCTELKWPYDPVPQAGNEGQGPPRKGAQAEALQWRVPQFTELAATAVDDIKSELEQGRCVSFSVPVYNSWYRNDWVAYTGNITMPVPNEVRVGGHAMCLVGYVDLPDQPGFGGGSFLLRNSWGDQWAIEGAYGVGYGTIPYAYIARYCMEAYSM